MDPHVVVDIEPAGAGIDAIADLLPEHPGRIHAVPEPRRECCRRETEQSRSPRHSVGGHAEGPDSWGDGRILYTDTPRATLEVYPSGWGCRRSVGSTRWRRDCPLVQWEEFVSSAASTLPADADRGAAGVLTVLSYDLKHWIESLPRRLPWPDGPVLYAALYDWHYAASHRNSAAHVAVGSPQAVPSASKPESEQLPEPSQTSSTWHSAP